MDKEKIAEFIFDTFYGSGDILDGGKKSRELATWHIAEKEKAKKEFAQELYVIWKSGGSMLKMIDLLEKTMKGVD